MDNVLTTEFQKLWSILTESDTIVLLVTHTDNGPTPRDNNGTYMGTHKKYDQMSTAISALQEFEHLMIAM
jgi:hypothetical protein